MAKQDYYEILRRSKLRKSVKSKRRISARKFRGPQPGIKKAETKFKGSKKPTKS